MTERSTFDPFEQRIADDLERYVAAAADPRPATEVARVAMRPRGLIGRIRNVSRPRRFLLLGLAAAFLVPAAYIGAITLRPSVPDPTPVPPFGDVSIFLRRDDGPEPGVSILAARPDGAEMLVRRVPDSIAGRVAEWGTVSESGWLALAVEAAPWPMIIIDLNHEDVAPWVVDAASTGGIGPRWGPTGLIAADAGSNGGRVVIADPRTHATRILSMRGGLVGGGPSIVWTADGGGIVGSTEGGYQVVPIDGSDPRPGVGAVFDGRGGYGPAMAGLRICSPDMQCPGGGDGRVERVELDGSTRTIWQQQGNDRALSGTFGRDADEYWLTVDRGNGRQLAVIHVQDGHEDPVATINRDVDWQYVDAPLVAPDDSMAILWIDIGAKPAAVIVPFSGAPATFHAGQFAGFVDAGGSTRFAMGPYAAPPGSMPTAGAAYAVPPVEDLIAAELRSNPGRRVLGMAARDGVEGQTDARTFEVTRDQPGAGEVYLECFGPSEVTVTSGAHSVTNPCLRAGASAFQVEEIGPIIVTASGETSWRVVIYSP